MRQSAASALWRCTGCTPREASVPSAKRAIDQAADPFLTPLNFAAPPPALSPAHGHRGKKPQISPSSPPFCTGVLFSIFLLRQVAAVLLDVTSAPGASRSAESAEQNAKLVELYAAITLGASSFLNAEYRLCAVFVVVVSAGITLLISWATKDEAGVWTWSNGTMSAISFAVGAITSIISGFIGMRVAVFSNARCTVGACAPAPHGWTHSFNTAFRAGGVMGFSLTGVALMSLYFLIIALRPFFSDDEVGTLRLMECIAGFGLGGSSIAMFGRVGGGIYTKAADVGADLAGKVRSLPAPAFTHRACAQEPHAPSGTPDGPIHRLSRTCLRTILTTQAPSLTMWVTMWAMSPVWAQISLAHSARPHALRCSLVPPLQ